MEFGEREMDFGEAAHRHAELKRQHEAGTICDEEFDERREQLVVQDDERRWQAKGRETDEWFYCDESGWMRGTPPGLESKPKPEGMVVVEEQAGPLSKLGRRASEPRIIVVPK